MDTLFFLLEHLYRMTGIPIRCLDATGQIMLFNKGYKKEYDPFSYPPIKQTIITAISKKILPFIESEDGVYVYACLKDTTECAIVLGPIAISKRNPNEIKEYAEKHHIPHEHFFIASGSMVELVSAISVLYFNRYGKTIKGNELFMVESAEQATHEKDMYVIANTEEEISRLGYEYERQFVEQIKNGDVSAIEHKIMNQNKETVIGKLANNVSKHFEYMVCTSLCLASRAAIAGGLPPANAYALSDIYLQRLEGCKDISDMLYLHNEMQINFAKQVSLLQQTRSGNSHVEKCKIYVNQNLNAPFSLDDIAHSLNINKRYLARIFAKNVGMTIMEYAKKKRIQTAANMLKYSDERISEIAMYLTFPNQSHFGKVFKDIMGVTPKHYRTVNQTIEIRKPTKNL